MGCQPPTGEKCQLYRGNGRSLGRRPFFSKEAWSVFGSPPSTQIKDAWSVFGSPPTETEPTIPLADTPGHSRARRGTPRPYVVLVCPVEAAPEDAKAPPPPSVRHNALQLLDRAPRVLHEGTRIVKSRSTQCFRQRKRQGSDRALPKHVASQVRHRKRGRLRTVRGHAKRDEQDDEGRNDRRRRGQRDLTT